MIRLQARVHEPEVGAGRADADRAADRAVGVARAQVADRVDDAQHDVHRVARDHRGPRDVRRVALAGNARAAALAGDRAVAVARAEIERALAPGAGALIQSLQHNLLNGEESRVVKEISSTPVDIG